MRGMLILIGFQQDTTIIEEDSQEAIKNSRLSRIADEKNKIKILKVASADNTSDWGTERLALPLFLTSRIIDKSLMINLYIIYAHLYYY